MHSSKAQQCASHRRNGILQTGHITLRPIAERDLERVSEFAKERLRLSERVLVLGVCLRHLGLQLGQARSLIVSLTSSAQLTRPALSFLLGRAAISVSTSLARRTMSATKVSIAAGGQLNAKTVKLGGAGCRVVRRRGETEGSGECCCTGALDSRTHFHRWQSRSLKEAGKVSAMKRSARCGPAVEDPHTAGRAVGMVRVSNTHSCTLSAWPRAPSSAWSGSRPTSAQTACGA